MSRGIRFKLYDQEEKLALAFQHHCQRNLGISRDLNELVKLIFLKFLRDSVDKSASDQQDMQKVADVIDSPVEWGSDESREGVNSGDSGSVTVTSDSTAAAPLEHTPAPHGEVTPAT